MWPVPNDIKQRIVLEGETQYKQALKDAQRNLKTLRSELKAETAELGNNATAQQKAQVKTKNLQQQIREQEKAVKAHRDALEEVREKYGDNADAIAKYEQRLNDARATLANLKNQLDAVGNSYDTVTSGAKQSIVENNALAESFGRIGDAAKSISGVIENVFSGVVNIVKGTVGAIWGELMDIAAKSDNYMDLASYFGSSATEVQKWESAMKGAAGDLSTVTGLITKLKYSGKDKNVAEWFGVSAEEYTNDLEYFQVVMQRMADSREEMEKAGTWDTAMEDIFGGKKAMDAEGVLSDWEDILSGLKRFNADEGEYGLNEDQIKMMADLNTQVATLKESWQKLKEMATVHLFGDLAVRITGNLQNIVDAFKDYMNADDPYAKKAALESIKKNVREMFEAIAEAFKKGIEVLNELADEFENSDDATTRTIGGVIRGIKNALEWLADPENWEKIKRGIQIVLGIWLLSKLATVGTALAGIVTSLTGIMGFKSASLFGGAAAGAGASAAGAGAGATAAGGAGAAKVGFFGKLAASGALHGAAVAGGGLALIAAGVYGLSEMVNAANERAEKAREVQRDENRYTGFANDYSFSGINKKDVLETYVNALMKTTGDTKGNGSPENILRNLAGGMGADLLDVFNYTNTSGEKRNKLMDMLNMDDQNAAIAAMMLKAAGVDMAKVDYADAYQKYLQLSRSGGLGFSGVVGAGGILTDFFDKSMIYENGRWVAPGMHGTREIMPVINGQPLANMSGYVMTGEQNKPRYSNGSLWWGRPEIENTWGLNGTWDPTRQTADVKNEVHGMRQDIEKLPASIVNGISRIRVIMDKEQVGYLVADSVSQAIARGINMTQ